MWAILIMQIGCCQGILKRECFFSPPSTLRFVEPEVRAAGIEKTHKKWDSRRRRRSGEEEE